MLVGLDDDRRVSYLLFQDVEGNEIDKRQGTFVCVEKAGSDGSKNGDTRVKG
jgi:hypothetical protein